MTDNSILIGSQQSLPKDLLYTLKPSSVRCRSYRCSVAPSNKSTFSPSDNAIFDIPCRRNTFLDTQSTYMRITVKNLDATALNIISMDSSVYGLINRFDCFHGSNLLETIQDLNVLHAYLTDVHLNTAQRAGLEAAWGCQSNRKGVSIAGGGTVQTTFCVPILSGVVGAMNSKMLPLSLADSIRLEFTLADATQSVAATTNNVPLWSIVSWELCLNILELSDEGMLLVQSVTPFDKPIFMAGSSFRHYSSNITTSTTGSQHSILIPARFASLNSLIVLPRRTADVADYQAYSTSSRVNPNISQYYFRCGSLNVPQKPVTLYNSTNTGGFAEAYQQLLNTWSNTSDIELCTSITKTQYNVAPAQVAAYGINAASADAASSDNAFAISQEFESISNRSDVMLTGTNTLNQQTFLELQTWADTAANAFVLDIYAHYAHILVLDEYGLLQIRF